MHPGIKLKCDMVRYGLKQYEVASKLGVCPTLLNRQLNGKAPIAKNEIARIRKAIHGMREGGKLETFPNNR